MTIPAGAILDPREMRALRDAFGEPDPGAPFPFRSHARAAERFASGEFPPEPGGATLLARFGEVLRFRPRLRFLGFQAHPDDPSAGDASIDLEIGTGPGRIGFGREIARAILDGLLGPEEMETSRPPGPVERKLLAAPARLLADGALAGLPPRRATAEPDAAPWWIEGVWWVSAMECRGEFRLALPASSFLLPPEPERIRILRRARLPWADARRIAPGTVVETGLAPGAAWELWAADLPRQAAAIGTWHGDKAVRILSPEDFAGPAAGAIQEPGPPSAALPVRVGMSARIPGRTLRSLRPGELVDLPSAEFEFRTGTIRHGPAIPMLRDGRKAARIVFSRATVEPAKSTRL